LIRPYLLKLFLHVANVASHTGNLFLLQPDPIDQDLRALSIDADPAHFGSEQPELARDLAEFLIGCRLALWRRGSRLSERVPRSNDDQSYEAERRYGYQGPHEIPP